MSPTVRWVLCFPFNLPGTASQIYLEVCLTNCHMILNPSKLTVKINTWRKWHLTVTQCCQYIFRDTALLGNIPCLYGNLILFLLIKTKWHNHTCKSQRTSPHTLKAENSGLGRCRYLPSSFIMIHHLRFFSEKECFLCSTHTNCTYIVWC